MVRTVPVSAGFCCHLKFVSEQRDVGRDSDWTGLSHGFRLVRARSWISIKPKVYAQAVIVLITIWWTRNSTYFYAFTHLWRRTLRVMARIWRDALVVRSRCGPRQATIA
jgi:hypothetical protein